VVLRERLDHRDRAKVREQLRAWPKGVPVVLEASFGWGWLSDEIEAAGLVPRLSNCYKVEQMRQARGQVKTNQKDADLLSLLPFEAEPWWEVWRAPPAVRDRRERMRYRATRVEAQSELKQRIHAWLNRQGIVRTESDLFGVDGRRFLDAVVEAGRTAEVVLGPGAHAALKGLMEPLEYVRKELAVIAWTLREELTQDPLTRRLDTVPGFGLILSHVVMAEVGCFGRFTEEGKLARYSCLVPLSKDSGEPDPTKPPKSRHLGRRGNLTLKWAFIEAAHGAVRHGGRWRAMFDRATDGGKRDCGHGYIKVARELVNVVYAMMKHGTDYTETPPARPGSVHARKSDSGSGTGQPNAPTVQASRA
jgi:transposase